DPILPVVRERVEAVGGHVAGEVIGVASIGEAIGGGTGRDGIAGDAGTSGNVLLFAVAVAVVGPGEAPGRIGGGTCGGGGFLERTRVVGIRSGAAIVHVVGNALNLAVVAGAVIVRKAEEIGAGFGESHGSELQARVVGDRRGDAVAVRGGKKLVRSVVA